MKNMENDADCKKSRGKRHDCCAWNNFYVFISEILGLIFFMKIESFSKSKFIMSNSMHIKSKL